MSPTLGKQSLHEGVIAGLVGLVALMLYLAFYYRLLGVVTWFGMAIWGILAFALVSVLGTTVGYALTLAGVAGIIVSLGITADSYIVFYERLKDEVRHGKTVRAAVQPAFKRVVADHRGGRRRHRARRRRCCTWSPSARCAGSR